MAEIAETLGVSESRVSQIRAEALVLLRDGAAPRARARAGRPRRRAPRAARPRRREAYFAAVAARHAADLRRPARQRRGQRARPEASRKNF